MGILLGLLAAFGWGTGDFLTRGVTRQIGALRTVIYVQFFGLLAVGSLALVSGALADLGRYPGSAWLAGVIGGLIGIFASLSIFIAFERGVLMIVSPIAASYGAITVLLSLLSGETLSPTRSLGVAICVLGVILASIERSPGEAREVATLAHYRLPPGVGWAMLAAVLFGVNFWILGFYVVPALGPMVPVVLTRVLGSVVMLGLALITRRSAGPPPRRAALTIALIALLDTVAFAAYNVGSTTEQIAVVAVLSSLFAAVTVVLAAIFLRERIRWGQWLGLGLILAGIVLVSL
jgi:drug/metabolite transporter (DMT)-like permease